MTDGDAHSGSAKVDIRRLILALPGVLAMAWACAVFPTLSSEMSVVNVATAIMAGDVFKSEVLATVDVQTEDSSAYIVRSSILNKAAVIRLRLAEDAIRAEDRDRIDRSLDSLTRILDETLLNAPSDPFSWLARYWLHNTRNGFRLGHLRELRMSYDLGRYEGWIVVKRNGLALAAYSSMPSELAELAVSEFVGLVRWGFTSEAADIAAGPGLPLRSILYTRLKDLKVGQRRSFAQAMYGRDLDDVLVPGIDAPKPQIPMPVLPPGY